MRKPVRCPKCGYNYLVQIDPEQQREVKCPKCGATA